MKKRLIVIVGQTGIGKTRTAIDLALHLNTEIISADSRQFYKEMKIGTAAPTLGELAQIRHHFVGHLSISQSYNVSRFEQDVIHFLDSWFKIHDVAVMVGGSGLYVDAVCRGIDDLPDTDEQLRSHLKMRIKNEGVETLFAELEQLDPKYSQVVDKKNPNRILRALEVCKTTGKTYTSQRTRHLKQRNFNIIKIGLQMPKEQLVERIHQRVDQMLRDGLLDEVRALLPHRDLNALNTVGYKEIFKYFDGDWPFEVAIEKIKTHTRRYAKRQMTWFKKDEDIRWFQVGGMKTVMNDLRIYLEETEF